MKMHRLHGRFLQTQGHEPSNEEMSQALGLSNEQVLELQHAAEWPFSLDVSPNEDQSWADLLVLEPVVYWLFQLFGEAAENSLTACEAKIRHRVRAVAAGEESPLCHTSAV